MILSRIEKNANYCWSKLDAMISQKETELRHHLCVEGCKGYDNVYCSLNHNKKNNKRQRDRNYISNMWASHEEHAHRKKGREWKDTDN